MSKKIGICDFMCVGWLLAMLTGHMIPFLETLGPDKCLGSDNKLHDHSQDDQEGP